ncbi:hypothetical protein LTR39_004014, partial [Cryomyces antarcticus]
PSLQFRPVSKEEEYLEPHKKRRQKEGLHQVVQESRCPPFKRPVPNELGNPAADVDAKCPI